MRIPPTRLCLLLCITTFIASAQPRVEKGTIDAREFDLSKPLSLQGAWIWYDQQLLSPSELNTGNGELSEFPRIWNEARKSKSGKGYATYTATVLLPASPARLGLLLPDAYTSYKLWVNGKAVAQNGIVGTSKETTLPHWEVKAISFDRPGDTLQLVLQMSNFHHHKGGMKTPLTLGESGMIQSKATMARISSLVECGALFVMFIVFLLLYFQQGRKTVILYFALLCITWSIRSVFSNNYVFSSYFPDFGWNPMVRIEYETLYFTMIWGILFLSRLFTSEGNQVIKYLLVTVNGIFAAFTLLTSPYGFTQWLSIYLIIAGLLIGYGAVTIIQALINERIGSSSLTACIALSMLLFAYDIFAYEGYLTYSHIILSVGYIILFLLMALALLFHLRIIQGKPEQATMLRYDDLYKDDTYKM